MKRITSLYARLERELDPETMAQVRAVMDEEPEPLQLDFGSNNITFDGTDTIARFYVSSTATYEIEDCVVHDKDRFIDLDASDVKLVYEGKFDAKFAGPDVELAERAATGNDSWRAGIVGEIFAATAIEVPNQSLMVTEFHLKNTAGTVVGHLFRAPTTQLHGETRIEDHWVLRKQYVQPAPGAPVTLAKVSETVDLKTRLSDLKGEAGGTDTNRPENYGKRQYRLREYPKF